MGIENDTSSAILKGSAAVRTHCQNIENSALFFIDFLETGSSQETATLQT